MPQSTTEMAHSMQSLPKYTKYKHVKEKKKQFPEPGQAHPQKGNFHELRENRVANNERSEICEHIQVVNKTEILGQEKNTIPEGLAVSMCFTYQKLPGVRPS